MKPYTYIIKHKPTGRFYYGYRGANKLEAHEDLWNKYYTSSPTVKSLIKHYGVDSFETEVRRTFESKEQAAKWERKVLTRMRVLESGKWINANISGYRVPTEVGRKRISETHTGKAKTQEHKDKISKALKGRKNPTARQNLPADTKGKNNGMYGKTHSEETRAKMRKALEGRPAHNKGKPMSEEQKQKIRDTKSSNPRTHSEEAKRKISEKGKGRKAKRVVCEHCDKDVAVNIYKQFHGEKCRENQ